MAKNDQDSARSEQLMRRLADELIEMPEAERLEGEDAAAALAFGKILFVAAKAESGRRRMERAKLRVTAFVPQSPKAQKVTADDAREYLRVAAQNPEWTMAARELNDISDADVLQLYEQARLLESDQEE